MGEYDLELEVELDNDMDMDLEIHLSDESIKVFCSEQFVLGTSEKVGGVFGLPFSFV